MYIFLRSGSSPSLPTRMMDDFTVQLPVWFSSDEDPSPSTPSREATADGPPLPSVGLLHQWIDGFFFPPLVLTDEQYLRKRKLLARSLPDVERLPRNEVLGGYIFLCYHAMVQESVERKLFGLPTRYSDSVRVIRPGLPIFLYDCTLHHLHGVFKADGFGGFNIDPKAWEDSSSPGQSRFPAQVRVRRDKACAPLEGIAFSRFLHFFSEHHFRLELSVPQAIVLVDLFEDQNPRLLL